MRCDRCGKVADLTHLGFCPACDSEWRLIVIPAVLGLRDGFIEQWRELRRIFD